MIGLIACKLLVILGWLQTCLALPKNHLDANVNADIDAGTFANPSINIRPKFRYWLPDASVDPALVAEDIAEIASVGAGGFELLNYYLYGGTLGLPVVNYSTYGFGTPAYNDILIQILQAAKNNSLLMDYEIGPQSGQGVPAEPDNPGLAWHLISSNATISAAGGDFTGTIPGFGSGTLLSVVTASIIGRSAGFYETVAGASANYSIYTIDYSSLSDITGQVSANGAVSLQFPSNASVQEYIIYAAYYQLSGVRASTGGMNPQNFIQNGSFAVDHFSAAGAAVTTNFLEQYVLINGAKELLQEVGNYIWEDSVEITAVVNWTPALAATFQSMHGYSIGKYAILLNDNNQNYVGLPSLNWFYLDTPDRGQSYIDDYRATLTSLAAIYIEAFETWSHGYMNLQYSAQVGYNQPVDMEQLVPIVDAPEGESLGFVNSVDSYRQYSGPAHLAGRRILSTELGAVLGGAYLTTFPEQLGFVKRSFAGGHNMMVLHGATYSHQYPNTTWPGFTSFQYLFSEQHSRHQPAWPQGYKSLLDYVGRNQYVLQTGTPKIDILFYNKITGQNDSFPSLYTSDDLNNAGYTYTYASPENFDLPQAVVTNGVLAANGPAFKALVLRNTDLLTTIGAEKIVQWAYQGLPIIVSGGVPVGFAGSNTSAHAMAMAGIDSILGLPNVHQAPAGPLASTLTSIGIQPNTEISSTTLWYNILRQGTDGSDYLYVYNDGNTTSSGSISIASTATPYLYDASTGTIEPVYTYSVSSGRTTIPLSLAATESVILAFTNTSNITVPPTYVISSNPDVLGYNYSISNGLVAKATANTTITTSDDKSHTITLTSPLPPSTTLVNWTLTAESWTSPSNLYDLEPIATKTNSTHFLPVLLPWYNISSLVNASGIGYYTTTLTIPSLTPTLGAIITFPPAIHTLSVRINSIPLPDLDLSNPKFDISSYLVQGANTVEAITATTLFNALIPIRSQLMTSGLGDFEPIVGLPVSSTAVAQGLVGDVVVQFYESVVVE